MSRPSHPSRLPRAAAAAACVTFAVVAACDGPTPSTAAGGTAADSAVQVAYGVRHNLVSGGIRRGELRADVATFDDAGTHVALRGVRIAFFTTAGDSLSTLTARTGRYDLAARRVAVVGDVVVRARDGRTLTGPRMTYDLARLRLACDTGCSVSGGAPRGGIDADPGLREMRAATTSKRRTTD